MEYFFNDVLILEKLSLGRRMAVFYLEAFLVPSPDPSPTPALVSGLFAEPAQHCLCLGVLWGAERRRGSQS